MMELVLKMTLLISFNCLKVQWLLVEIEISSSSAAFEDIHVQKVKKIKLFDVSRLLIAT